MPQVTTPRRSAALAPSRRPALRDPPGKRICLEDFPGGPEVGLDSDEDEVPDLVAGPVPGDDSAELEPDARGNSDESGSEGREERLGAPSVDCLRMDLAQLGCEVDPEHPNVIQRLAKRLKAHYVPALGYPAVLAELASAFAREGATKKHRHGLFQIFNLLCATYGGKKEFLRCGWNFLKTVKDVPMRSTERHWYVRFVKRPLAGLHKPSAIWMAPGDAGKGTFLPAWQQKLKKWFTMMG